jgi:L-aminopeptidase/D-esterase-like protein
MKRREFSKKAAAMAGGAIVTSLMARKAEGGGGRSGALDLFHGAAADAAPAGSLTDVDGLKVGHWTDTRRPTGCTVVIAEKGAVAGVDVRGGSPGTRETDLLNPINAVQQVFAVMLSGGSAFGLDTATGAMRFLDEQNIGYKLGPLNVPIVPAAILFDLGVGDGKIRPDAESGYKACQAATTGPVAEGNVGAGAGATIGKLMGPQFAMKSGLGTASIRVGDTGVVVAAMVAVNAVGDIWDRHTGKVIAGARSATAGDGLAHAMDQLLAGHRMIVPQSGTNTTIGVVATNAALNKDEATKMAQMAQDGYARAINPAHTPVDGDTIFALSTGTLKAKVWVGAIGAVAAVAMSRAVIRAVTQATGIPGFPAYADLQKTAKP